MLEIKIAQNPLNQARHCCLAVFFFPNVIIVCLML